MPPSDTLLASLLEDLAALDARLTWWQQSLSLATSSPGPSVSSEPVDLNRVVEDLKSAFHQSTDLVVRRLGSPAMPPVLLAYVAGLVDRARVAELAAAPTPVVGGSSGLATQVAADWAEVLTGLLQGQIALFAATGGSPLLIDVSRGPHREVGEPQTELTVRGSREAFAETVDTQIAQLRARLPSADLVVRQRLVGRRLPSPVGLIYLDGVAEPTLVSTVTARLDKITVDTPVNATRVGALIRDQSWTLFPTVRYSERPDLVALALQQGKVAVLVNGDPFVLTVPATLAEFYRTAWDYSAAWYDASWVRLVRLFGAAFGVFLPAVYIALTEVNPDLVSPKLFDLVAGSHSGLPFTPLVEVVVMILVIEVLREAALRLPQVVASTIGTVGAIVVGTAIVKAGFVSAQIIVVMTFTALSLFSAPVFELIGTWRIVSWLMLLSAFVLGVYGIALAVLWVTGELVSLESFGTPYLAPYVPPRPKDWANAVWRAPWSAIVRRLTEGRPTVLRWAAGARPAEDGDEP